MTYNEAVDIARDAVGFHFKGWDSKECSSERAYDMRLTDRRETSHKISELCSSVLFEYETERLEGFNELVKQLREIEL
jgi:hypothetical protein